MAGSDAAAEGANASACKARALLLWVSVMPAAGGVEASKANVDMEAASVAIPDTGVRTGSAAAAGPTRLPVSAEFGGGCPSATWEGGSASSSSSSSAPGSNCSVPLERGCLRLLALLPLRELSPR